MSHQENSPISITPGAIRFNTDSMKLEYFRIGMEGGSTSSYAGIGTLAAGEWVQITTDTPEIQTGGTRGLFGGGYTYPSPTTHYNTIDYINVDSTGNAIDFGDLPGSHNNSRGATSSRTRGVWGGGNQEPANNSNVMDFVTIASTGNASDFGDLTEPRRTPGAVSNGSRGVWAGGRTPTSQNIMDYVTIAATGNAIDFGDLALARVATAPLQSSTRGLFAGGYSSNTNIIEFITTATLGNAADFGELTTAGQYSGSSNSVRGLAVIASTSNNTIEYVTMATLGNAQDFGDANYSAAQTGAVASPTRLVYAGGYIAPTSTNNMGYVQIMSLGNGIDFGDLTVSRMFDNAGCSNGHGGLG